ncbi:hypothetical protein HCH54_010284 [Aspergillus fumigatus]
MQTRLLINGFSVSAGSLIDCGANAYACINTSLAISISQRFGTPTIPLEGEHAVTGFDGKHSVPLTHAILLTLAIDNRVQRQIPFLILDIGRHDIILGRMWLAKHQILVNCAAKQLIWSSPASYQEEIAIQMNRDVPRSCLGRRSINQEHQRDAIGRDRRFHRMQDGYNNKSLLKSPTSLNQIQQESNEQYRCDVSRSTSRPPPYRAPRTEGMNRRHALLKMERAFRSAQEVKPAPAIRIMARPMSQKITVDIAAVGAVAFHRCAQKQETTVFTTSLYELDRLIKDKRGPEEPSHTEILRLAARELNKPASILASEPLSESGRETTVDSMAMEELSEIKQVLPKPYHDLADIFLKSESDILPPHRGEFDHRIELDQANNVGYGPLYKMNAEELEAAREYIIDNLHKGFIVPSNAPFASPILMAEKPGGGLRFCVDYRKLNAITKKDRYPLPLIDEVLDRISRAKIFTKLDIRQGFHRIRMDPESEDLTTFRSRYGSYKYRVMPFGLTNGPAAFQRFVNHVFIDCLDKYLTAFVDDLLIYSDNELEHQLHVRTVLQRLRENGLQVSLKKCEFHVTETRYLGFIISTEGIKVDPRKVEVIQKWAVPTTVKGVQSFLGFCNFYRRFIEAYSRIARPLINLTKSDTPFKWTPECEAVFQKLKQRLVSAPLLRLYDPSLPTRVETDASAEVVAAVLSQRHGIEDWHPVAFYSKTMSPAEQNYDIHDREMLAIIRALEEWRAELEGLQRAEPFDVFSDHQALQYFMTSKRLNARQARWAEFISRFRFIIQYRPGRWNTLADALSRPATTHQKGENDHRIRTLLKPEYLSPQIRSEISALSGSTEVVARVLEANRTAEELDSDREKARAAADPRWTLQGDHLLFQGRLVVPDMGDLRARLLDEIHRQPSTAHPGKGKMRQLVKDRYYWTSWSKDVDRYVANCLICQRSKTRRDLPPGLLQPLPIPDRPWQHISMDFRSFPRSKNEFDAAFVVVDRLTKRPVAVPCYKTTTAKDMARLFLQYIYPWTGLPETIVSDRGGQFISEFWDELCKILQIQIKLSSGQHPQTNGQTEIMNQYIAQRLRPFVSYYQDDWDEWLPILNFAAAALPSDSTGLSPFLVERGYEPRTSFDWTKASSPQTLQIDRQEAQQLVRRMEQIWELAKSNMQTAQRRQKVQADKHRRELDFDVGDYVFCHHR